MAFVAEERGATGLCCQDAVAPFAAERCLVNAALSGHQPHHAFRLVGIQIVANDTPAHGFGCHGKQGLEKGHELSLAAAIGDRADNLSCRDVECGNQGLRTMTDVFELASLDPARRHRQGRCDPLQRLDAAHLVDRDSPYRFLGGDGAAINGAHIDAFGLEFGIRFGREPRPHEMRLEIGFFLKSAPPNGARWRR